MSNLKYYVMIIPYIVVFSILRIPTLLLTIFERIEDKVSNLREKMMDFHEAIYQETSHGKKAALNQKKAMEQTVKRYLRVKNV